jgi:hypothetical protein
VEKYNFTVYFIKYTSYCKMFQIKCVDLNRVNILCYVTVLFMENHFLEKL